MSRKTMLLAAGVLGALAFAALPAVASAQEYEVHCPVAPCVGTVSGTNSAHAIEQENDKGEKIDATEVRGKIVIEKATSTTFTIHLEFLHVYETSSGFKFTCNSPGQASGVITVHAIGHFINLETGGTKPGVILTNNNVTYTCSGFLTKTLTGNIIGTITTPNCNVASATTVVTFNKKAVTPGTQEHELWTGVNYDLISGSQSSDGTTTALTAQFNITWEAGNKLTVTC